MEKIDLDTQKKIQLEMLKEIKNICDKNSITYFLGGGTLLGAIRHKGYIPWDDDIDIMLPRKDYDNLINTFNEQADDKYKLIYFKNCKNYYYPFAKIVDTRTKLIENDFETLEDMGIYIDVFPIDELPDDKKNIKKVFKKYNFYCKILNWYRIKDFEKFSSNKVKAFYKKIAQKILHKINLVTFSLRKIEKICKKYYNTNTVACITGRYQEKEIMPKSYMSDYVLVDFEGEKFKAPKGYDQYLEKHYGDYMKLPPKEKQIAIHDNFVYWR